MSQLIDFYVGLLHFCGLEVDEATGRIYDNSTSKKVYILVDGKEMVLPTYENLRKPNIGDKVIFHPIPEHVARAESPVIEKLTHIVNIKLNIAASGIFRMLAVLMHNSAKFKKLNPTQSELLNTNLKMLDKTGLMNIEKIMTNSISKNASRSILHIFLKKGAIINAVRYSKGAIVSFPMHAAAEESDEVFSVKLREKDKEALIGMYKLLFPGCEIKNAYSRGSNNDFIPYLESLYLAAANIAKQINEIVDLFPEEADEFGIDTFDLSFMDANLTDVINEARRIPSQPGNTADHPMPVVSPITSVNAPQQAGPIGTPALQAPVINPNNTLNFGNLVTSQMPQAPFMPFMPASPIMTPFGMVGGMPQMQMAGQRPEASWLRNYGPGTAVGLPFVGVNQAPMYPQQQPIYPQQQPMYPQQPIYPQQPAYPQQPMYGTSAAAPAQASRQTDRSHGRARF